MNELNHKLLLYIVILIMAMSSIFFYSRWDITKKEKTRIEDLYASKGKVDGIEEKTRKVFEETKIQNIELQKRIIILNKKIDDLRKAEGYIKQPSEEQLNAIQKNDIKITNDTLNKLGYSTTIIK